VFSGDRGRPIGSGFFTPMRNRSLPRIRDEGRA
jgi:hypothetical protein